MSDLPLVTVGLPTYNREWSLPRVLESLIALDYEKKRLRVCFVDNLSGDRTMEIIESFRGAHQGEYEAILVVSMRSNIPQARNAVFEAAEGTDYVFFLDSDVVAPPGALRKLLAAFAEDPRVGMAALPCDNRNARKRAGFLFRAFAVPFGPHDAYKVATCCTLISMAAHGKVGGFDEVLRVHEDSEFSFRLRRAGYRVLSDSSLEGDHLKDIPADPLFYLRFVKDSAATYRELMSRGSLLHISKVVLSYLLLASFVALLLRPEQSVLASFVALLAVCAWLNSSAMALDDGAHTRMLYRPVIGLIFTATTFAISILLVPALFRRAG